MRKKYLITAGVSLLASLIISVATRGNIMFGGEWLIIVPALAIVKAW